MEPTFNLIDEPWIPCTEPDGRVVELGLRQTLARAHQLGGLHGESPLITAALYRLLLAVLHSALRGPQNRREWSELWQAGAWDMKDFDAYLDHWHDRFYLFHSDRPFYQSKDGRVKPKSIISLIPDMSSGNNATLFDHHTDATGETLSAPQAARTLVAAQHFSLAGPCIPTQKMYFKDGICTRGIIFLLEGDTLFETLALNLIRYNDEEPMPIVQEDKPTWEMDDPFIPVREFPQGYLDYLTWQNRRVLYIPETANEGIVVRNMTMAPGLCLDPTVLDPMKHYRKDEKRGEKVWRFTEGRVLWRDSAALFELSAPDKYRPPLNIKWVGDLVYDSHLNATLKYRYMALGMANDQAKVEFYREENMPLPLAYFEREERVEALSTALELAEKTRNKLWGAVNTLGKLIVSPTASDENGRQPDTKDVSNLTGHWGVERNYWGSLEIPFLELIEAIPKDPDSALAVWRNTLQRTAWDAFRQAERLSGTSPAALKAAVNAGGQLAGGLAKLFPKPEGGNV